MADAYIFYYSFFLYSAQHKIFNRKLGHKKNNRKCIGTYSWITNK